MFRCMLTTLTMERQSLNKSQRVNCLKLLCQIYHTSATDWAFHRANRTIRCSGMILPHRATWKWGLLTLHRLFGTKELRKMKWERRRERYYVCVVCETLKWPQQEYTGWNEQNKESAIVLEWRASWGLQESSHISKCCLWMYQEIELGSYFVISKQKAKTFSRTVKYSVVHTRLFFCLHKEVRKVVTRLEAKAMFSWSYWDTLRSVILVKLNRVLIFFKDVWVGGSRPQYQTVLRYKPVFTCAAKSKSKNS